MAEFKHLGSLGPTVELIHVCVPRFKTPEVTKLCAMNRSYEKYYERIKKFEVYKDDIWVVTYPKCGTTFAQEMVYLINSNLDYEGAKVDIFDRFPMLEFSPLNPEVPLDSVEQVKELISSPRYIKSHLCTELLPDQVWEKNPKIVYVARDPRDAAVSSYHFVTALIGLQIPIDTYVEAFLNDTSLYAPFFEHILDFWSMRNEPNILFLTYEEMVGDLMSVLKKVMHFFSKNYSQEQLEKLKNHLSVENMRKNPATNQEKLLNITTEAKKVQRDGNYNFIRKGEIGTGKKELSPETIKKFDEWIERSLKDTDFPFYRKS